MTTNLVFFWVTLFLRPPSAPRPHRILNIACCTSAKDTGCINVFPPCLKTVVFSAHVIQGVFKNIVHQSSNGGVLPGLRWCGGGRFGGFICLLHKHVRFIVSCVKLFVLKLLSVLKCHVFCCPTRTKLPTQSPCAWNNTSRSWNAQISTFGPHYS